MKAEKQCVFNNAMSAASVKMKIIWRRNEENKYRNCLKWLSNASGSVETGWRAEMQSTENVMHMINTRPHDI